MDCLEKLVDCIARFNKGEINADTSCQIEKQILTDEIQDPEFLNFAVENISELFGYIATGRVNIRICRDITGLPDYPSERLGRAGVIQAGGHGGLNHLSSGEM